jgi:hypothetical protein
MVQSEKWAKTGLLSIIVLVVMLATAPAVLAQASEVGGGKNESPGAASQEQGQDLGELGKQLNNPISSVWYITTQSNMYFYKGDLSPAYRGQFVFNLQPVLPIPLTEKWNLIPRPVFPIVTSPYVSGVDFSNRSLEWSRAGGLGDIGLVTVLSPNFQKAILGFGPTFIFPTATNYNLGQGKFQMGPAVVVGFVAKKWIGGVFPQHWWSLSGTPRKPPTNQTNIQYFLFRMLPEGWQVGFTPNILIDWHAEPKNRLTFPLGIGVGRTFKINPNTPPIQMTLEFQWMPVYPEDYGQRFNIRYVFKPVLPNLVKKPLFE